MATPCYSEEDLLPISALQHLMFCPRQCALIHIEQIWSENRLTAEGRILHERVHAADAESRRDLRVVRGLRLRSLNLGLIGIADVVEFHRDDKGVEIARLRGRWRVTPVEYKRGRPKPTICDEVQLCAQAICLEEMLGADIPAATIFYGQPRRRHNVALDAVLREATLRTAVRLHDLIADGVTPPPVFEKKCLSCSLFADCMPKTAGGRRSAKAYLETAIDDGPAC